MVRFTTQTFCWDRAKPQFAIQTDFPNLSELSRKIEVLKAEASRGSP
uniref:Uncharacterized protein n=1 Tax=Anguilla anguilla TaxID=7936 RepID=A0A0E9X4A8_ANGAN